MTKAIIAFALADLVFSLISAKVPWFCRTELSLLRWEKQKHWQRFCSSFFPLLIAFVVCMGVINYRDASSPSSFEEMLESGEWEYFLVTDVNEIGDADIVYEVRKDSDNKEICEIIASICKELNKAGNDVSAYLQNEKYIIMDNNMQIGSVTVSEKEFGLLLKFKWQE